MRIAVVFFGIARGIHFSIESIKRNIYASNADHGFSFYTVASLNMVETIRNPRADEIDVSMSPADALLLNADAYALVRQNEAAIAAPLAAAQLKQDIFDNDWLSIKNLLHQLVSLQRAWTLCTEVLGGAFDYFLFLRPDLIYLDEIRLTELILNFQGDGNIAMPAWLSSGGFNDRFAFADVTAARHYANRLNLVKEYSAAAMLHSESLLAYALWKGKCKVCELPVRAERVRATGAVIKEGFSYAPSFLDLPVKPKRFSVKAGKFQFYEAETDLGESGNQELAALSPSADAKFQGVAPDSVALLNPIIAAPFVLRRQTTEGFARTAPLRGVHYLNLLKALHAKRPASRYLEIGTQHGMSLDFASGRAVAIDPNFLLDKKVWAAKPGMNLFEMTSDAFFADLDPCEFLGGTIDLAFIDGMHLSEFVLRDFTNVERHCSTHALIILHDAIPQNFEMTERERRPAERHDKQLAAAWTGDVWRIVPLLRRERPDLCIQMLDCPPTGLAIVSKLDPHHRMPPGRLDELTKTLIDSVPLESEFWSFIESLSVTDSQIFVNDHASSKAAE